MVVEMDRRLRRRSNNSVLTRNMMRKRPKGVYPSAFSRGWLLFRRGCGYNEEQLLRRSVTLDLALPAGTVKVLRTNSKGSSEE
jgi:hypothetical protein